MKFDLEDRLIRFSLSIHDIVDTLPRNIGAVYMAGQLIRSGTAPALIYGEALAAESRRDFIHKMKLVLKELRESGISLKIIRHRSYFADNERIELVLKETNELISIFVKSIQTAQSNLTKPPGKS